jgi:hypothetical protein
MFAKIAFYSIWGKPFTMYAGLLTLLLLLVAAVLGRMATKGKVSLNTHKLFVALLILAGLAHAVISFGALMGL